LTVFDSKIAAAEKKKKDLEKEVAPYLVAADERSVWAEILNELSARVPRRYIWITQLVPVESESSDSAAAPAPAPGARPPAPGHTDEAPRKAITHLEIKGLYLDTADNKLGAGIIDEFYDKLAASPVFATGEDRTTVITERTTPSGETWAYGYAMRLPLKNPIPLP
jgi:hypothetical protein